MFTPLIRHLQGLQLSLSYYVYVIEERLFKSFDDQQKVEHEAREIETLIKSFEGASGLLPDRQYGSPVDPTKFGLTLKSIIERNHKELAAYLKISTGYWERQAKEQAAYDEMTERMKEMTETLRQQNQEETSTNCNSKATHRRPLF